MNILGFPKRRVTQADRKRRTRVTRNFLKLECLENRKLMAADTGWHFEGGDALWQDVTQAVVDDAGATYLAISNRGEIDFVPDQSFEDDRDIVSTPPGQMHQVIAKFDAQGVFQWATPSSLGVIGTSSLSVDGGGVYVHGVYDGPVDLDVTDEAANHLISSEDYAAFFGRLDSTTGKFDWVHASDNHLISATAKDGSSFLLLSSKSDASVSFDGRVYTEDTLTTIKLLVELDASGQVMRTQRIGSYDTLELTDVDVADFSDDRSDWTIVTTGVSNHMVFFGDTPQLHTESFVGSPVSSGDMLAFGMQVDGAVRWANAYDSDGRLKGFEIQAAEDGSVYVDGRVIDSPASGITVLDPFQPDGALNGEGDFLLRLNSNGSFGTVLHHPDVAGTYKMYETTTDGLILGVLPENPQYASISESTADFIFGDYLLDGTVDRTEFIFEVGKDLKPIAPLLVTNHYFQEGSTASVHYKTFAIDGEHVTAAATFRGDGTFPNGETFSSPYNAVVDGPSSMIFTSRFALPAPPDLPSAPDEPVATVVFEDSFEMGSFSNDWNAKWVEDSQNDWFRSSQRATEGNRSAEVDGYANNATLTMSEPVDLSGFDSATLSFQWFIESSFDSGEYIAADLWNGSSWTEVARRSGNQDSENTWANEAIEIDSAMMSSDFKVRFRAKVSRSNEDANIDNVRIVGVNSAPPTPNASPSADVGSGYVSNEGGSVQLDASNSFDPDGTITAYAWDLDGDGSFDDATGVSVTLDTPDSGEVNVAVQVTDDRGATDADSTTVTVNNLAPTAIAGGPYTVDVAQTVTVDASGSFDPGNDLASYAWDLDGDGVFEQSGITAGFTASTSGDYTIGLRVTDADGAISDAQATVTVEAVTVTSGPNLSHGEIGSVSSTWQTITLPHHYDSMVVITTPRYNHGSGPGVTRVRNAEGNSFQLRIDDAGSTPFSGGVHYVVVEEGIYNEDGFKLEAVKMESTITDRKNSWSGQSVAYQQSYTSPVVVGQVMTTNDSDWSVFYATGASRTSAPNASSLRVGKHVGEDSDTTRASETIGFLVIEATQEGTIEGLPFVAGLGSDTVRGVGNGTYHYSYTAMPNSKTAVLSSAGMDGGDGGWAVLMGDQPITPTGSTIDLAIDEDQLGDAERNHTTEQVAYLVIDPPQMTDPMDVDGDSRVTAADALRVINRLARSKHANAESESDLDTFDVNQDGVLSALDALVMINRLRRQSQAITASRSAEAADAFFATPSEEEDEDHVFDELITSIL